MRLRLHGVLERSGGAARVSNILETGLRAVGWEVETSCEIAEPRSDQDGGTLARLFGSMERDADSTPQPGSSDAAHSARQLAPAEVGPSLAPGELLHLHGARDLPALLAGLRQDQPILLTLHDCRFLTGGCPYPVNCQAWREGCPGPCPRQFPDCATVFREQRDALLRHAPLIVSPSAWLARMARAVLPGLRIRVLPNGVPIEDCSKLRQAWRERAGLAEGARVAVFIAHGGESAAYKAGDRWQWLWERIKAREPRAVAWFVGGETLSREGDLVRWPYLRADEITRLLAAADVFVHPTLADNHPLVILEAMAAGLPVAGFAVGGLPEQVLSGETGLLAKPGDWTDLAAKTARLLGNDALARSMGRAGRERALRHFTAARMLADYQVRYREAVGKEECLRRLGGMIPPSRPH